MIRNKEIDALEDEVYRIERDAAEQIHPLHARMENIRSSCEHERHDNPCLINPWWCGKCGGPMPKKPDHTEEQNNG